MSPLIFFTLLVFILLFWKNIVNYVIYHYKLWFIPSTPSYTGIFPGWLEHSIRGFYHKWKYYKGTDLPTAAYLIGVKIILNSKRVMEEGVFKGWIGATSVIMITRPEAVEVILKKANLPKTWLYGVVDTGLGRGNGLVTSNGQIWKSHRKLLTPAFDYQLLGNSIKIMNLHFDRMIDQINVKMRESANGSGLLVDNTFDLISPFMWDISCETAMGISSQSKRKGQKEILDAITFIIGIINKRLAQPWLISKTIFDLTPTARKAKQVKKDIIDPFIDNLMEEIRQVAAARRKEQELQGLIIDDEMEKKKKKKSLLQILSEENLNHPDEMTRDDILAEVGTFIFAGFESTTKAILWALLHIGHHADVQDKIIAEVDALVADRKDGCFDIDDVRSLRYTEAAIKESMRLNPVSVVLGRDLNEDVTVPLGQTGRSVLLPKGGTIIFTTHLIHRSQPHWPDPEKFDPERFLTNERRHPYSFIPFSAGPRNCIAQKLSLIWMSYFMIHFFRHFRIQTEIPIKEVIPALRVTMGPTGSYPVRIFKRKENEE